MTHQVTAMRQGSGALLRCDICGQRATLQGFDFEGMNEFVAEHKLCLDASA